MQARQQVHVRDDGSFEVEDYDKLRVTTNSSFGGVDGVNASVPEEERVVALPRVQALARAAAIMDTIAEEADSTEEERPRLYVVDAESAALQVLPVATGGVVATVLCAVGGRWEGGDRD
eukprot:5366564-Pleurochrysis_carterae.AAC.3